MLCMGITNTSNQFTRDSKVLKACSRETRHTPMAASHHWKRKRNWRIGGDHEDISRGSDSIQRPAGRSAAHPYRHGYLRSGPTGSGGPVAALRPQEDEDIADLALPGRGPGVPARPGVGARGS